MEHRIQAIALVALLAMVSVPAADPEPQPEIFFEDSTLTAGWTTSSDGDATAGMAWHALSTGSDSTNGSRFVGLLDNGDPNGYQSAGNDELEGESGAALRGSAEATYHLTSPVLDAQGKRIDLITFDVRGSSKSEDILSLSVVEDGDTTAIASVSGTGAAGAFQQVRIAPSTAEGAAALALGFDSVFQLQFSFYTDWACDGNRSAKSAEFPAGDDPHRASCDDNSLEGFYVDNLTVVATHVEVGTPPGQGHPPGNTPLPINFPAWGGNVMAVHAKADAGRVLGLEFNQTTMNASASWNAVNAVLTHSSGHKITLSMAKAVRSDGTFWTVQLPVDDVDLRLGNHALDIISFPGGEVQAHRAFTVQGVDDGPPTVGIVGGDGLVSEIGSLQFAFADLFPGRFQYKIGNLPAVDLAPPYRLPASALLEGTHEVTVTGTDRAGNTASATANITKDTEGPKVNITLPEHAYAGVPFDIKIDVEDLTATRLLSAFNGTLQEKNLAAGGGTSTFTFQHGETGNVTISFLVRDAAGHAKLQVVELELETVITNVGLVSFEHSQPPYLATSTVTFDVVMDQQGGVITIPASATITGKRELARLSADLPNGGEGNVSFGATFSPGMHTVNVHVAADEGIIETDPSNQNGSVTFEVFAGRVDYNGASYHIRVSEQFGLPLEAIHLPTGTTFRLSVPDGLERNYRFNDGDTQLYWDPLSPITVIQVEEDEPAPGIGFVGALGILALLGVARRRR